MCKDHLRSKTHVNNKEKGKLRTQSNGKSRVKGKKNPEFQSIKMRKKTIW